MPHACRSAPAWVLPVAAVGISAVLAIAIPLARESLVFPSPRTCAAKTPLIIVGHSRRQQYSQSTAYIVNTIKANTDMGALAPHAVKPGTDAFNEQRNDIGVFSKKDKDYNK